MVETQDQNYEYLLKLSPQGGLILLNAVGQFKGTAFEHIFDDVLDLLNDYAELSDKGKEYPDGSLELLLDRVEKLASRVFQSILWFHKGHHGARFMIAECVQVYADSLDELRRAYDVMKGSTERIDKVAFIDAMMHLLHERGSALPPLLLRAPDLAKPVNNGEVPSTDFFVKIVKCVLNDFADKPFHWTWTKEKDAFNHRLIGKPFSKHDVASWFHVQTGRRMSEV